MPKRRRSSGESTLRDIAKEFADTVVGRLDAIECQLRRIADAVASSSDRSGGLGTPSATPISPPPAPRPPRTSRRPRATPRRGGGQWTFRGKVRMDPADGEAIRRDDGTMSRDALYAKWAHPNGRYTRAQVAGAVAWLSGPLPDRKRKSKKTKRRSL